MTAGIHRIRAVQVRSVIEYGGQVLADDPYFRDDPLTNTVSTLCLVFRNHSATSFAWKAVLTVRSH